MPALKLIIAGGRTYTVTEADVSLLDHLHESVGIVTQVLINEV